jgi:flagellar biosynthesis protein
METKKKAAAVKYHLKSTDAPRVVAKGRGVIADKILEIAKENNVPLLEDNNLVQVLEALDIDSEIPPELYRAVAEVLVFIYRLNGSL